jgi:O-antigen ligase
MSLVHDKADGALPPVAFPHDTTARRLSARLPSSLPKIVFAIAILAGLFAIFLLNSSDSRLRLYVLALVCAGVVFWGIRYATRNPSWFIFALVLEEVVPYLSIIPIDPGKRWFLRYPILLALAIPAVWQLVRSRALWRGSQRLMVLFCVWALVTCTYSLDPAISLGRLIPDVLVFGTLIAVAQNVHGPDDLQTILGRFVLGCGLVQVLDFVAYFFLPIVLGGDRDTLRATWMIDLLGDGVPRFAGVFNNPNAVGAMMTVTILSGVAHWRAVPNRGRKLLLALSMAASVFFAVMADSRSEIAAAVLGCMAYGVWKFRWRAVRVIAVLAVLAILGASLVNPQYFNRGLDTATGRTEAWSFEIRMIEAQPLRGYGYQVEGAIFQNRYWTNWQDFWDHGPNTALHNGYISIAIGMGLPALVLWFVTFFAPWSSILRNKEDPWGLKPLFFLVAIPIILLSLDESVAEPRGPLGLLVWVTWALAARYQIVLAEAAAKPKDTVIHLLEASALRTGYVYLRS